MIDIFRAYNPEILDMIEPHMSADDDISVQVRIETIEAWMNNRPDDICVIVIFDDDVLKGCIIGRMLYNNRRAWIDFAWAANDLSSVNSVAAFNEFVAWASEKGARQVRMETKRSPEALARAYKFKSVSTIMKLEI